MAKGYRRVDRDQVFLLPPSMRDWLPDDHLVWFVIEAVERLDTSAFHTRARLGGVGRRGFDPDMLLCLFVYAMAHGVRSSRQIERLCHTDVAFRVICAQGAPDHTVLARFRRDHEQAMQDLLTQTLVLAAELGMVRLGVVAFDGTRIAANASKDANRGEAHLRKLAEEFVDTVAEIDEAEDTLFGENNRGDELPPDVRDRTHRKQRIAQALEQVTARGEAVRRAETEQAERVRACERAVTEGVKGRGRYPKGADRLTLTKIRWEHERAKAQQYYEQWHQDRERGERRPGAAPVPPDEHCRVRKAWANYQAEAAKAAAAGLSARAADVTADAATATGSERVTANLTDPDSRLLKTRNGWIQGYNCQTAASEDAFILTARATQDANDVDQFDPTMNELTATALILADRTGRDDLTVGTMVGDAGYDSADNLAAQGPDRLIADGKGHTITQRAAADPATGDPPELASLREKMNHRLRTPEGHTLYKRRGPMIEAPNAWLKDGRGLRRFSRRGLAAAHAELSFACAVTNLLKIATKGITAAQLRAG